MGRSQAVENPELALQVAIAENGTEGMQSPPLTLAPQRRVVEADVGALSTSLRGLDQRRELERLVLKGQITLTWVRTE